jgi:adenine-specific DNA-methyltransferase
MIKYLGSKRLLLEWIYEVINSNFPKAQSVLDLFSGTSRVGHALKSAGLTVLANDHNLFAYHLARCYVETDLEDLPPDFDEILKHLNNLPPSPGFFTEKYCINSRFFHPKNGARIDAIRPEIDKLDVSPQIRSVLLVSLMEAADRVDSTCGIQMAFLKSWAKRASQDMVMRAPKLVTNGPHPQKSQAFCLDALKAATELKADVTYLDPPYNQHSYRGNYHIWETLMHWDNPSVYGKAQKRVDCQTIKSDFNSKKKFATTLETVIKALASQHVVLSFSDEGFISRAELSEMLLPLGRVTVYDKPYKRYVGAQIGIYNPSGEKVGNVKHLHNNELLFVLDKSKASGLKKREKTRTQY